MLLLRTLVVNNFYILIQYVSIVRIETFYTVRFTVYPVLIARLVCRRSPRRCAYAIHTCVEGGGLNWFEAARSSPPSSVVKFIVLICESP